MTVIGIMFRAPKFLPYASLHHRDFELPRLMKGPVEYLIEPAENGYRLIKERVSTAVPVLVFFFLLLVLYLSCYARLMQTIAHNPGYTTRIPHSPPHNVERSKEKRARSILSCTRSTVLDDTLYPVLNRTAIVQGKVPPPPGIEYFTRKDVFICDAQGLPLFCDICNNYKPDRTHHCSEVDRCVRRMDHFCPWVGGIVSETNIKFFLQFLFYAAAWGIYTLGFSSWAISDRISKHNALILSTPRNELFSRIDGQWIALIAMTGLLGGLFAGGMFLTTFYNAAVNRSTNEQVVKRSYCIAVRLPQKFIEKHPSRLANFPTITYPLNRSILNVTTSGRADFDEERNTYGREHQRTYAILQSKPSENIWSVSITQNLKSVLGERYIDWLLPLKYPPCVRHDDPRSDYPLGPDFEHLCREAGIRA
ncbi:hypothetical protein, variant [Verruconis gallopava]|uniref:Palmitoyltransferase n=1 Tax=Verruconis gallopava TaxID=253628 RepID=A0A0D2ACG1_9PEZI|nr:hypothetical protein, variant [Verruconis gallopava]KIW04553.1 hypothetical protein, variant [Verruconis gallopava]